ncbi:helix-turn-helix domain-containing protein [Nocardiopsis sp. JB363]|uniref:helix-turn-helix domain-containing protein n=1 Tax=Nocardiopsis sp. JB363 TaxID=1434837 RepID=UPI00097B0403|nr:helix-turn-helix domain-containing protein [Nocardiopsis sp. JB363]SIO90228.1 Regulator of polyketide synthase expression [Nocardiopsis sp. JB363]
MAAAQGPRSWPGTLELLARDRDDLVEDFLHRLRELGHYDDGVIPADDLRQTAVETFDLLTRRIAGLPVPAHLRGLSTRLGVRRARQGVARDDLLEAVRMDFRVLWAGLVRAGGDDSAPVLVLHVEEVLEAVEQFISDVQAAFLEERTVLERDSRAAAAQAFARLLSAGEHTSEVAGEVASVLGLPLDGVVEVTFVVTPPEGERPIDTRALSRGGCLTWEFNDGVALVREPGRTRPPALSQDVVGARVHDTRGLAEVPAAIEAARVLARYARPGEAPVTPEDVWPALARDRVEALVPGFGRRAVERVEALDPDARARLLETLAHYTTTGSVKATAASLYCHRNTVVNRLQHFREVSGLDLTIPAQAALALVLFADRAPTPHRRATNTASTVGRQAAR